MTTTKTETTFWVRIYMSGPIEIAKQVCRKSCMEAGLCVTIEPTLFIYTGGEETGFVVGLINYPRFPAEPASILTRATALANELLAATHQSSWLAMTPNGTIWRTNREDEKNNPAPKCLHDFQVSSPIDTVEVCRKCGHSRPV